MDNTPRPTTTLNNATRASQGTTWDTWYTSWDDETRTWNELSQLMNNTTLQDFIWSYRSLPWQNALPWQTGGKSINNVSKP